MSAAPGYRLTGRAVAAWCVGAFGVIIAANATLLVAAIGSFPGIVVANSYVASQDFDARRAEAAARGWVLAPTFEDGILSLSVRDMSGQPVRGLGVVATVGRPAQDAADRAVALSAGADGYAVPLVLPAGRWQATFHVAAPGGAPLEYRSTFAVER